jgi:hypothetical protein
MENGKMLVNLLFRRNSIHKLNSSKKKNACHDTQNLLQLSSVYKTEEKRLFIGRTWSLIAHHKKLASLITKSQLML